MNVLESLSIQFSGDGPALEKVAELTKIGDAYFIKVAKVDLENSVSVTIEGLDLDGNGIVFVYTFDTALELFEYLTT